MIVFFTVFDLARAAHRSPDAIRRRVRLGRLAPVAVTASGTQLFSAAQHHQVVDEYAESEGRIEAARVSPRADLSSTAPLEGAEVNVTDLTTVA